MPATKKPASEAPIKKATPAVEEFQKEFDYENGEKLLEVKGLKQYFHFKGGVGQNKYLKAVHDVNFDVYKGEVFGLVGESGCGKTTTGRSLMRLYDITSGDVILDGIRISAGTRWNEKEIKYVNIRAHDIIAELTAQRKSITDDFSAAYVLRFGSAPVMKVLEGEDDGSDASFSERKSAYNDYLLKVAPIDNEIKAVKEEAARITAEQRAIIHQKKKDDKNYNKNISKHEQDKVQAKYWSVINKVETSGVDSLSEEDKKEYESYKSELARAKKANLANKVQMIFQDPIASLNPRMTVRNIIAEGLVIQGCRDKEFINQEVARVLKLVGLVPEHANRYPHEFSGGQRQRIGIARAIIMKPELIIADEPVSALDVSVQAQVINLLNSLRNDLGLTIIFIAHNLSVVKYFCDRIAVMYYGNLVELASSDELFAHPLHPYTKSLLSAVPYPDPVTEANRTRITYNPAESHDYSVDKPRYREIVPGHFVRCNDAEAAKYLEELKK